MFLFVKHLAYHTIAHAMDGTKDVVDPDWQTNGAAAPDCDDLSTVFLPDNCGHRIK